MENREINMSKNLLIVESPAKAKTIEKILGKDFTVKSSYGHVRDLDKDGKGSKAIDVANNYKPQYIVTPDKIKVVRELKDWVAKVDEVWLATDDDREGEAISWHLAEVLNLDVHKTKRIVFREITKPGITQAVSNPRTIDLDLVNAQQARRVLDRLVGFELSELLWKKVKGSLSAGRVQSVTVKLVVEREREIQKFSTKPYFKISAQFQALGINGKPITFKAELPKDIALEGDAKAFLEGCKGASYEVKSVEVKPGKKKPAAPFTTSTLQQEASRKLYFNVARTMSVAQKLYEAGHITYMRTDSTNLSETAIASIAQAIEQNYGKQYVQTRRFKTSKAGAQEAHEAIRPTYIEKESVSQDRDEQRLYELIWKRTIASQMSDAELEITNAQIGISTKPDTNLVAQGEVLKFDGFLKVYMESKDEDDEEESSALPPLKVGQKPDFKEMQALQRYSRPPARYTEASLVKKLEELGIGRPSTYAPTISKIMEENRGYVVRENRDGVERTYIVMLLKDNEVTQKTATEITGTEKGKLFPTDMGLLVTEFLDEHFKEVMNYNFTADVENKLDDVADGKENWVKLVDSLYKPFHKEVEKTLNEADRVSGERVLGTHPTSGLTVLVRLGKFGPLVQIGKTEELGTDKPKYANIKPPFSLESITFDEALALFAEPKEFGSFEGKEINVGKGRFGPFIKWGEAYINLPKTEDIANVTMEKAIAYIQEKQKGDAPIGSYKDLPITKGKGRFGPFIKWGDLYVNIPKAVNFDTISEEKCVELIEAKVEKEADRYIQQWPEHNLAIENGRWGPFIRMGKSFFKLPPSPMGGKMTEGEAVTLTLKEVIDLVESQGGKVKK